VNIVTASFNATTGQMTENNRFWCGKHVTDLQYTAYNVAHWKYLKLVAKAGVWSRSRKLPDVE